jgi:hypothetical protein
MTAFYTVLVFLFLAILILGPSVYGIVTAKSKGVSMGGGQEQLQVEVDPDTAYADARTALASKGNVTEEDPRDRFLRGTAMYGLQKVHVKLDVAPHGTGALIRVRTQGSDVWGKAAKVVIQRLIEEIVGK